MLYSILCLLASVQLARGLGHCPLASQGRATVQGRSAIHTAPNSCRVGRSGSVSCVATEPLLAAPVEELDVEAAALQSQRLLADGVLAAARVREIMEGNGFEFSSPKLVVPADAPAPFAAFAPGAPATEAPAAVDTAPVPPAPAPAAPAPPPEAKKRVAPAGTQLGSPLVLGLSHKTATVEVREKLSISETQWNEASAALCEYDSINEASVISTCNRFEVYLVAEDHYAAARDAMAYLKTHSGLEDNELRHAPEPAPQPAP